MVIGRAKDTVLGSCRIESVTNDLAMATPMEGEGFRIGDVVRLIEAGKPSAFSTQAAP